MGSMSSIIEALDLQTYWVSTGFFNDIDDLDHFPIGFGSRSFDEDRLAVRRTFIDYFEKPFEKLIGPFQFFSIQLIEIACIRNYHQQRERVFLRWFLFLRRFLRDFRLEPMRLLRTDHHKDNQQD